MIYDNIHALCEKGHISIHYLEQQTGIANGTIRKWNRQSSRVDRLLRVADFFGVTLDELVRGPKQERSDTV